MKEYKVIYDVYEPKGGSFKYAINPEKFTTSQTFTRSEREDFIERCRKLIKETMYYDNIKMYFIDYDKLSITEIENIKILEETI